MEGAHAIMGAFQTVPVHHQQPLPQLNPIPVVRLHDYQIGSGYPPTSFVHQSNTHLNVEDSTQNIDMMANRQEYIDMDDGNRCAFETSTPRQENDVGETQAQTTPCGRQEQCHSSAQPQTLFLSQSSIETDSPPMDSSTSMSVPRTTTNASTSGRDSTATSATVPNSNYVEREHEELEESKDADEIQTAQIEGNK